jgi:hypothetical protein
MTSPILPSEKEIGIFIANTFGGMFADGNDTGDMEGAASSVRGFVERYVRLNFKLLSLCLTGQEEFSIFQREEQAPKKTPRPE